jgi:hypothetical protein
MSDSQVESLSSIIHKNSNTLNSPFVLLRLRTSVEKASLLATSYLVRSGILSKKKNSLDNFSSAAGHDQANDLYVNCQSVQ